MNNTILKKLMAVAALLLTACAVADDATIETADMIVLGDYLVTMDPQQPLIPDGALVVVDDKIIALGSREDIIKRYQSEQTIGGAERILMPGLINGHTHSSMTLLRGLADDQDLMTWLNETIFPMEGKFVNPAFVRTGTELACWEMIRGGTTTFVDMYFYPDTIADVVSKCGLRAIIAAPAIDFPSPGFKGWDDSFAAAEKFVTEQQGKHPRITPAFAPHAPYTVNPEHLTQVAKAARKLNAPISIHLAESPSEIEFIQKNYQNTPIRHVAESGLLDGITLIGAHMVHPDTQEIQMLADSNVGAIHNPTSNLKLASGISPVPAMLDAGVAVGLGTDGAVSNNDLDLWEDMRLAALIHKQAQNDPTVMSAQTVLEMATRTGAAAIGLQASIGSLEVGKAADFIQISLDSPRLAPLFDVVSHLVYMVDSSDVVTTVVAGKLLMLDAKVLTLDGNKIKHDAQQIARKIIESQEAH